MIIIITGSKGDGKTLLGTYLTHILHDKGLKVLSNYKFNKISYTKATIERLFMHILKDKKILNTVVILDEIQTLVDSRRFSSDINLLISYFALQTRKTNVYLIGTTQHFDMIEKRMRDNCDIMIECESFEIVNGKWIKLIEGQAKNQDNVIIRGTIYKKFNKVFSKVNTINIKAKYVYDLYDTTQVIKMDPMKIKSIMKKIKNEDLT